MYNVKGHGDLARDPKTNAIINVNDHDYQHYVEGRNAKRIKNESLENMKDDLDGLKSEMNEIKSLLKELGNGN